MTWLSFAAKSGSLLLVTPLVLRFFTPAETSLWFLFLTINAITQMADFGFGPSFVRAISYARAGRNSLHDSNSPLLGEPNQSLLAAIYVSLQKSYQRLTLIGGCIALVLGSLSLVRPISQLGNQQEGWLAWAVVWMASLVVFRNSAYAQWLQGMNMVAFVRRVEAAGSVVATGFTALVLWLTKDFLFAVVAAALGAVIASFVVRLLAHRSQVSPSSLVLPEAAKSVVTFVWPAAWRSGIGVLMSTALFQASGIIVAQFAAPVTAASYLLAMRVMQVLLQVSMAPFYSKLPLFASHYAAKRFQVLIPAVRTAIARSHWIYVTGVLLIAIGINPLLSLIGSQTNFLAPSLWLFLGVAFFIERFGAMHLQLYSLSNHILWHIANGVSGSIYLIVSLLFLHHFGIAAFPIGIIFGYAGFYSWFAASRVYKHYNLNILSFEFHTSFCPALLLLFAQLFFFCTRFV